MKDLCVLHIKIMSHQQCLEFFMIKVYKYLKGPSPQIINYIFKLRKNTYNLRNVHLFESQKPWTKPYGLYCIAYRVFQIWQTFPNEIKDSISIKNFKHKIIIITLRIFSDSLIYVNILEHFNLMLDQIQCVNTFDLAWRSILWRK